MWRMGFFLQCHIHTGPQFYTQYSESRLQKGYFDRWSGEKSQYHNRIALLEFSFLIRNLLQRGSSSHWSWKSQLIHDNRHSYHFHRLSPNTAHKSVELWSPLRNLGRIHRNQTQNKDYSHLFFSRLDFPLNLIFLAHSCLNLILFRSIWLWQFYPPPLWTE